MTAWRLTGIAAAVGAALYAVSGPALGQRATDDALEELVVVGTRLEETIPLDLQQFGNRVEIITAEELRLGGFNDLSQSLQMKVPWDQARPV